MATLKWTACTVTVVVCLALFPCGAFGEFEIKNSIIHSAEGALAAFERLQTSCKVGLTHSEYARALDDVQFEVNKFDEYFTMHAEEALTRGTISPYFDVSTWRLLSDLHYVISFHELVKEWWERQIQKHYDPICLDLMFSDEWEEITLLMEDASEYLERMKESCREITTCFITQDDNWDGHEP